MEGVIISFIGGTVMLGYCILILCKYDAIKGIAIKGTMYFEDFSYEYHGKKYVSSALRPGFNKRKGKEYRIWVKKIISPKYIATIFYILWVRIDFYCAVNICFL